MKRNKDAEDKEIKDKEIKDKGMILIGITGGVGAGKSEVLSYIASRCRCRIVLADEVGNDVKQPGQPCYERLVKLLGKDVLDGAGYIDKGRMAEKIFADPVLLKQVNGIIHPAVKEYLLSEIERERRAGEADFFFIEAALLIEEGYDKILDQLWYIHADQDSRRKRLRESRGYADEKIERIFKSQLPEEEFRRVCSVVIDNSGGLADTYGQIDAALAQTL